MSMNFNHINDMPYVVTCTTNKKYLKYLIVFLESIKKNSSNTYVIVRLVNCYDTTKDKLMEMYDNVYCIVDDNHQFTQRKTVNKTEIANKSVNDLLNNKKWLYTDEAAYCSNIKFNTMNRLIDSGVKIVVYVDVDTIVNNCIDSIVDVMYSYDIGMFVNMEEHTEDYYGWNAGIQVVSGTPGAVNLYRSIEDDIKKDMFNLEADEDIFDTHYKSQESTLRLCKLDKKYKDDGPEFDTESCMWSGHAENKFDNDMFREAYEKYLDRCKLNCLIN